MFFFIEAFPNYLFSNDLIALHTVGLRFPYQGANSTEVTENRGMSNFDMLLDIFNIFPAKRTTGHRRGHHGLQLHLSLPAILSDYI